MNYTNMSKLVSVIIPAYNVGSYLKDTLESVISQSYTNWECLVIDDGSTDETSVIVRDFVHKDSRILYFHKSNGGLCSARNYGLSMAKGDYIQYLDGDDLLFPDKLDKMIKRYEHESSADIILFCDFIYGKDSDPWEVDGNYFKLFRNYASGIPLGFEVIYAGWDSRITIPIHCFLFPTKLVQGLRFDQTLKSKEDWSYHLSILDKNLFFLPFNYVGCSYRVTNNSMSKNFTTMIEASLAVLHIWKRRSASYIFRVAYYILQAYMYKLKGLKISFRGIFEQLNANHKSYRSVFVLANLMIPFVLISKVANSIRIRIK